MKPPLPSARKKVEGLPPPQWRSLIWYVILMLGMLWVWQEAGQQVSLQTIPHSQFKDYVRQGEVVECPVKETEKLLKAFAYSDFLEIAPPQRT